MRGGGEGHATKRPSVTAHSAAAMSATVSSVDEADEDQTPGPGAYDQDPITFRGEDGQLCMSKARSAPSFSFGLS